MLINRYPYYEITQFREDDGSHTLLRYKCACELWDQEVVDGHPNLDPYHLTANSDDELEDFDPESERVMLIIDFTHMH